MVQPKLLEVPIGSRRVGGDNPALIVAEIGTGYASGIDQAFRLIDAAAKSGADCAKFQTVFAEEIVHPQTGNVDLPGGPTPLFEVFQSLERNVEFFAELKTHTEKAGLLFLSSPFGLRSAKLLHDLDVGAVKIASPELNHYPLLDEVARWNVPVIASTGVSTLGDIEKALRALPDNTIVLHCVTAYPAPARDYNVRCISTLSPVFGRHMGISDHSLEPCLVPGLAVACGAAIIEKHFTLDKENGGLDDPVALTPDQFKQMSDTVRSIESLSAGERWAYIHEQFGRRPVEDALGTGRKRLADSESENYLTTNRSIIAVRDIEAGSKITTNDFALLRSEKNLRPGIAPDFAAVVEGRRAARRIPSGSGIVWDDLFD